MSAPAATLTKLLAWRPGGYLRASGALFGWLAVRTAAQTALFVLVARTLGADGYGSLIAVMAVATLFAPLAGLGGQAVLLRDGARNPRALPVHLGDALRRWAISVVPTCAFAYFACRLLTPTALDPYAVAVVVLADVAGVSLLEVLARTWQAAQRMNGLGAVMAGLIVARLTAFHTLSLMSTEPSPKLWVAWYGGATAVYVSSILALVLHTFGRPQISEISCFSLARKGLPFAFAGSAMRAQAEANKPILAQMNSLVGVGVFSAAQRVTDLLIMPLQAFLEVIYPRAYQAPPSLRHVFTLGLPAFLFAAGGSLFIIAAAPWIPLLLGESYNESTAIIRILAFLPIFFVVRMLLTTIIIGKGGQQNFYIIFGLGATASVATTLTMVPLLGPSGAALSAYAPELTMIIVQIFALARMNRASTQNICLPVENKNNN